MADMLAEHLAEQRNQSIGVINNVRSRLKQAKEDPAGQGQAAQLVQAEANNLRQAAHLTAVLQTETFDYDLTMELMLLTGDLVLCKEGDLAEELCRIILQGLEDAQNPKPLRTGIAKLALGRVLKSQGKLVESEQVLRQLLQTLYESYGMLPPTHARYADGRMSIGIVLRDLAPVVMSMGDLAEAERVGRRWLELADDIPHCRSALEALTYLARVLMEQERYAEAEPLWRRSLHLCEQQLGKADVQTATALAELAASLTNQGKVNEAEELHQRSLDVVTAVQGALAL